MPSQPDNESPADDDFELYLQVFLDESDEQLEQLVETLLALESTPEDEEKLNEAFRLLHTHKGSAGLMGFEGISDLAHQLEHRFDEVRTGKTRFSSEQISAILKCVDFLRSFNQSLRSGESTNQDIGPFIDLLESSDTGNLDETSTADPPQSTTLPSLVGGYQVRVTFEAGLQLADMKARLLVARLSNLGEIVATEPAIEDVQSFEQIELFTLILNTDAAPDDVKDVAQVDGVSSVEIVGGPSSHSTISDESAANPASTLLKEPQGSNEDRTSNAAKESNRETQKISRASQDSIQPVDDSNSSSLTEENEVATPRGNNPDSIRADEQNPISERTTATETVRVGIDRLDGLMNLTGELVISKARFEKLAGDFQSIYLSGRSQRDTTELIERLFEQLSQLRERLAEKSGLDNEDSHAFQSLIAEFDEIKRLSDAHAEGSRQTAKFVETLDQLNRVAEDIQQSVLETRMVPVAPLFNRFRRVVRDLSREKGKDIRLEIRGEKTELDKRMIDELGDPLLHLVRNAIDHGIETEAERSTSGKDSLGTIGLEAIHSGNNVFIHVSDDGRGLDVSKISSKLVDRGLVDAVAVRELSEEQILDYIWEPGFSTAGEVTDISGRGVGMDVVKRRIQDLNGAIHVENRPGQGAMFVIRLPLTLAIVKCLQVRIDGRVFSIPISDVREIVTASSSQIRQIHGHATVDVRGEIIPLIDLKSVFYWAASKQSTGGNKQASEPKSSEPVDSSSIVLLEIEEQTAGLLVQELCGSGDVVIKSLADNFVSIQGLSGASVLGDGSVSLLLDAPQVLRLATDFANGESPSPVL